MSISSRSSNYLDDLHFGHLATVATCEYVRQNNAFDYGAQVGCIIVDRGEIVSMAVNETIDGVRLHAEEIAMQRVEQNRDLTHATLYVTLEPCNGNPLHERLHCCEQIAARRVGRVVMLQPKRLHEGGANFLRRQGVEMINLRHPILSAASSVLCNAVKKNIAKGNPTKAPLINPDSIQRVQESLRTSAQNFPPMKDDDLEAMHRFLGLTLL